MKDVSNIPRPMQKQLKKHLFQEIGTQILPKLIMKHVVMCINHNQCSLKHKQELRFQDNLYPLKKVEIVEQCRYTLIL